MKITLILVLWATVTMLPSYATVYFQNTGTRSGWSRVYVQHSGSVTAVSSPSYKGTCLRFQQIWEGTLGGHHSEAIKANAQSDNTDRYYGKVIYFPGNWVWENKNHTFSQWSSENPEGPWCLMWLQNQNIRIQRKAGSYAQVDLGAISRGVWIRVVNRFKLGSSGVQQVWINGTQKMSSSGVVNLPGNTARWSNGIYCTGWRTEVPPSNARTRTIYQDHFRIASSYAEANPSSW